MPKIVVSDTSCLIVLSKIGKLDILRKLYSEIIITPEIANEFGDELPAWISEVSVTDVQKQKILEIEVDRGEASAIALSIEINADLIIVDDFKARKVSNHLGLTITGTLGVLVKARNSNLFPSIKPVIEDLNNTNFRVSTELIEEMLRASNEG